MFDVDGERRKEGVGQTKKARSSKIENVQSVLSLVWEAKLVLLARDLMIRMVLSQYNTTRYNIFFPLNDVLVITSYTISSNTYFTTYI